jgi:hypothetical protein
MSKRISEPVHITKFHRGRPAAFLWRSRALTIEGVIDWWEEAGCWWRREKPRRFFHVRCSGGLLCELEETGGTWVLSRMLD